MQPNFMRAAKVLLDRRHGLEVALLDDAQPSPTDVRLVRMEMIRGVLKECLKINDPEAEAAVYKALPIWHWDKPANDLKIEKFGYTLQRLLTPFTRTTKNKKTDYPHTYGKVTERAL
jgi:hypothetical protein